MDRLLSLKTSSYLCPNIYIYVYGKCIEGWSHYLGDKQDFEIIYPLPTLATVEIYVYGVHNVVEIVKMN